MTLGNLILVCARELPLRGRQPYWEVNFPYSFEDVYDIEDLVEIFLDEPWNLRTGFLYRGLAFVQLEHRGDEWLCLWQVLPEVWVALESYHFTSILQSEGEGVDAFAALVDGLAARYGRRDD
jgi:hypothetical protein